MFGTMGFSELMIILVIILIIFGAGRLPQIGEGVGKALKGFKKEVADLPSALDPNDPQAVPPTEEPMADTTDPSGSDSYLLKSHKEPISPISQALNRLQAQQPLYFIKVLGQNPLNNQAKPQMYLLPRRFKLTRRFPVLYPWMTDWHSQHQLPLPNIPRSLQEPRRNP